MGTRRDGAGPNNASETRGFIETFWRQLRALSSPPQELAAIPIHLLDRPAGPDLIGVLAGGYFGGAGLWALAWALHFVGIVLRVVLKYTMAAGFLLALFYLLTGSLPF